MNIECPHKGCNKLQVPYYDKVDNNVYCSLCDKELIVTNIVKQQLKQNKRFRETKKKKVEGFAIKCESCQNSKKPKVLNKKIICSVCDQEMKINEIYKNMLINELKQSEKEVE